jgi:glutathione S-transferase
MPNFRLISFPLCPYVQRAAILLAEKGVPFERVDIDLAARPGWFLELSPLGKVPVLVVEQEGLEEVLFESAVIAEYLDEILEPRLHPADPLERARHRAWIEFSSATLTDIYGYYTAPDAVTFAGKETAIAAKLDRLEQQLGSGPYFAGAGFSLIDAAFAPAFRYFDTFERMGGARLFEGRPKLAEWREALAARPSVRGAAPADYAGRLLDFIRSKGSHLAGLAAEEGTLAA